MLSAFIFVKVIHGAMYRENGWPKISERRALAKLKIFKSIVEGRAPHYLCSLVPSRMADTRPTSQYADNFKLYSCRTELLKNSFIPTVITMYNGLELPDITITSLIEKYKTVSNQLSNFCDRIINIICAQLRMKCRDLNGHLRLLQVLD